MIFLNIILNVSIQIDEWTMKELEKNSISESTTAPCFAVRPLWIDNQQPHSFPRIYESIQ